MNNYNDEYHDFERVSWFKKMGESISNLFFGLILCIVACILLFWNEGRAVKTAKSLEEGQSLVVSVMADAPKPENEGKLIHFSGMVALKDTIIDPSLHLSFPNAVAVKRIVEMYQWDEEKTTEKEKKIGGAEERKTIYTYKKVWKEDRIKSEKFTKKGYDNPTQMLIESQNFHAKAVQVGGFVLPDYVKQLFWQEKHENLLLDDQILKKLPQTLLLKTSLDDNYLLVKAANHSQKDTSKYRIGDLRINYQLYRPQTVSVIGVQIGNTLSPFEAKEGKSIALLSTGAKTANQMFESELENNTFFTWLGRLLGYMLMAGGIASIFSPLVSIADIVPFFGNLLELGISFFSGIVGFVLSLMVCSTAWFFYRPWLSLGLVATALAIYFAARWVLGKRQ